MIFERKKPKFYITIAPKNIYPKFWGGMCPLCPVPPGPYTYGYKKSKKLVSRKLPMMTKLFQWQYQSVFLLFLLNEQQKLMNIRCREEFNVDGKCNGAENDKKCLKVPEVCQQVEDVIHQS